MPLRRILTGLGSLVVPLALLLVYLSRDKIRPVDPLEGDEAVTAIAMIEQKVGHPLRAVNLTIDHKELRAEIQNATSPEVTDEWNYSHLRGLHGLVDWHMVGGPNPVKTGNFGAPVARLVFDLKDIDFAAVPRIAAAAVARVALEETASVSEMSLSRPQVFGLRARVGSVRWRIGVHSGHEQAAAFANAAGKLTGVSLDGTLRAQRYNLYEDGKALTDAVHSFSDAFDGKARLSQAIIYDKMVRFEAMLPRETGRTEWWTSDIDGAHRETFQSPIAIPLLTPAKPFGTGDVDWTALPRLQQIARQQLEMPEAAITMVNIERDTGALGPPSLSWVFYLRAGDGDEGRIVLDPGGVPRHIDWPKRRETQKATNMLAAEQMAGFLAALHAALPPDRGVMELVFQPDRALAVLRDPDKPRSLAQVTYNGVALELSPMPPEPSGTYEGIRYQDAWLFDLGSLSTETLSALPSLEKAALARLAIKGGTVTAIGIGRHQDILSNARDINVEVDVQGDDRRSGRYYTDLHGHVLRVDEP